MAGILDDVDRRTQLVGANRLELLLFRLTGNQLYGINVFKVQEVIRCPGLTSVPNAHHSIRGIANMRGKTIPVIDLSQALAYPPLSNEEIKDAFIIIADYNRTIQGFLVKGVERIVNMNWQDILAPPKGSGVSTYLTAVTRVNEKLVEIIDVEKVLAEITGSIASVSTQIQEDNDKKEKHEMNTHILVADDSKVARNQIKRTLEQIGIECTLARDGQEALDMLLEEAKQDRPIQDRFALVISDVEMPNMDGYTLTTEIRKHPKLKSLYIILHTSLSGVFNQNMVQKVGANRFIPKFNPDELAQSIIGALDEVHDKKSAA